MQVEVQFNAVFNAIITGALVNGFPRPCATEAIVGGVRTNFRMPDVVSIGLGGGSLITGTDRASLSIGPQSVGHQLLRESMTFGGTTRTTTDIANAVHGTAILSPSSGSPYQLSVEDVGGAEFVEAVTNKMKSMIATLVDETKTDAAGQSAT